MAIPNSSLPRLLRRLAMTRFLLVAVLGTLALSSCDKPVKPKPISYHKHKMYFKQIRSKMVYIKGGTYIMGPPSKLYGMYNNWPAHKVHLSSFYILNDNVSYKQYDAYSKIVNLSLLLPDMIRLHYLFRQPDRPVSYATWYQARDYCQWLAKHTGLPYELPTEAQWQYVARNGGRNDWHYATNNGKFELGINYPSYHQAEDQKGNVTSGAFAFPIGSKPCLPNGVCGINGEVIVWIKDWYAKHYFQVSPVNNPQGPATGTRKVIQGGQPGESQELDTNYSRYGWFPAKQHAGFRCVINSSIPPNQLGAFAHGYPK